MILVASIFFIDVPADFLRIIVLMQIVMLAYVEARSVSRTFRGFFKEDKSSPLHPLRMGRLCRGFGMGIALGVFTHFVLLRFGHQHINFLTPLVQLCLIFWLASWHLVDRRDFRAFESGIEDLLRDVQGRDK